MFCTSSCNCKGCKNFDSLKASNTEERIPTSSSTDLSERVSLFAGLELPSKQVSRKNQILKKVTPQIKASLQARLDFHHSDPDHIQISGLFDEFSSCINKLS